MTVKTNERSAELFLLLYTSVGFCRKHGFEELPAVGTDRNVQDDKIEYGTYNGGKSSSDYVNLVLKKAVIKRSVESATESLYV